jgi:hypothetical protein
MRNPQTLHPLTRIVRNVILFLLGIFLLVSIIHLAAGWQSLHQYGNGLVWTGAIGIILLLVGAGWRNGRREDLVALSSLMREHEVFYLLNRDNDGRAGFLLSSLLALVIAFSVGLILLNVP